MRLLGTADESRGTKEKGNGGNLPYNVGATVSAAAQIRAGGGSVVVMLETEQTERRQAQPRGGGRCHRGRQGGARKLFTRAPPSDVTLTHGGVGNYSG